MQPSRPRLGHVAATPEKGKASAALIVHLAKLPSLRSRGITVHRSQSSPFRLLLIENTTAQHVLNKLCPEDQS